MDMTITAQDIAALFTSWYFINVGIPFLSVAGGIFVKVVSRPDKELKVKPEDWAVGFDIAIGALIIFITKMVAASNNLLELKDANLQKELQLKIISVPWLLLVWVIGLWGISTIIRKWGWKKDNSGQLTNEYDKFRGIIIPLVFGIVSLLFAVNWTGGDK